MADIFDGQDSIRRKPVLTLNPKATVRMTMNITIVRNEKDTGVLDQCYIKKILISLKKTFTTQLKLPDLHAKRCLCIFCTPLR